MKAISNFINMLKGGQGNEYEDDEMLDENMEFDEDTQEEYVPNKRYSDVSEGSYSQRSQSKIVPMNTAVSSSKMVITQPSCYGDVEEIGEYLRCKKAVIINLENVCKEDGQKILDFMSGATFMIEGTIQKVSNLIYLVTPKCVEIQNDAERREYKQQKMNFSWMK